MPTEGREAVSRPPRTLWDRVARAVLGSFVAVALLIIAEMGAREWFGPPVPTDLMARVGACRVVATGLRCPERPEHETVVPPRGARPRVVILGGSTVRNIFSVDREADFPLQLQAALPEVEVVNLGISGSTTASILLLMQDLEVLAPSLVVLHTGHNDYNFTVFRGEIRAASLWRLPFERAMSYSRLYTSIAAEAPHLVRRDPNATRVLAVQDDIVRRIRPAVDARFREELTSVVRASPAPVLLSTLFRNHDYPPTGVLVAVDSACARVLAQVTTVRLGQVEERAVLGGCGPDSSIGAWIRSRDASLPLAERQAAWRAALNGDDVPMRAPASADAILREVASAEGVGLIDVATVADGMQPGAWFVDPLHTNVEGATQLAAGFVAPIRAALAKTQGTPRP